MSSSWIALVALASDPGMASPTATAVPPVPRETRLSPMGDDGCGLMMRTRWTPAAEPPAAAQMRAPDDLLRVSATRPRTGCLPNEVARRGGGCPLSSAWCFQRSFRSSGRQTCIRPRSEAVRR
eukprot:scaffold104_cov90-Isochrysis_galbana.AAC.1